MRSVVRHIGVLVLVMLYVGKIEMAGVHQHAASWFGPTEPVTVKAEPSQEPLRAASGMINPSCALCAAGFLAAVAPSATHIGPALLWSHTLAERSAPFVPSSFLPSLLRRGPPPIFV